MGADGGSIPKRCELVRTAKSAPRADKESINSAKWQLCALSKQPLCQPIVSCRLGNLYNKESILRFLLGKKSNSNDDVVSNEFSHISTLRDVKKLRLVEAFSNNKTWPSTNSPVFECPLTKKEMNGKSRFVYIFSCGCTFSEGVLKQLSDESVCPLCGKLYKSLEDVIALNPSDVDASGLKARLSQQREKLPKSSTLRKGNTSEKVGSSSSSKKADVNGPPSTGQLRDEVKRKLDSISSLDSLKSIYKKS